VDTLMKSADLALYEAKRAGKNTYRISACPEPSVARRNETERESDVTKP